MIPVAPLGRVAAAALLTAVSSAQVVINEVAFSTRATDQWIELHNRGATQVNLGGWSLYYATLTPGQPDTYWYPFRAGTAIDPNGLMRVHWRVPVAPQTKTDVYTGDTPTHFLFGLTPEPLLRKSGAVALVNSQQVAQLNSASAIQDWLSWGSNGFAREQLAIQAGRWRSGEFVTAPIAEDSIALDPTAQYEPTPATAYFHDASPTPLGFNTPGAGILSYGRNCSVGAVPAPLLRWESVPTQGNRDFRLSAFGTALGQFVALVLSPAPASVAVSIGPCPLWIDVSGPLVSVGLLGANPSTPFPLGLLGNVRGGPVFMQALTAFTVNDYGLSQGVAMVIGR